MKYVNEFLRRLHPSITSQGRTVEGFPYKEILLGEGEAVFVTIYEVQDPHGQRSPGRPHLTPRDVAAKFQYLKTLRNLGCKSILYVFHQGRQYHGYATLEDAILAFAHDHPLLQSLV